MKIAYGDIVIREGRLALDTATMAFERGGFVDKEEVVVIPVPEGHAEHTLNDAIRDAAELRILWRYVTDYNSDRTIFDELRMVDARPNSYDIVRTIRDLRSMVFAKSPFSNEYKAALREGLAADEKRNAARTAEDAKPKASHAEDALRYWSLSFKNSSNAPWIAEAYAEMAREAYGACAEMARAAKATEPVPMLLWCPSCNARHIDEGEFATKPHHTHACQSCGMVWRPAVVPTVGVAFLPGFKSAQSDTCTWPGCTEPALCTSGNFNNQLVCRSHFMRTNGGEV